MGGLPCVVNKRIVLSKRPFQSKKGIPNLKKGKIGVSNYALSFNEKMKLVPYLVPIEISKIKKIF